mgnify:CR=1 FL=1
MKDKAKLFLTVGIVFLVIGIILLITGAVSRTIAYGDFVLAFVFLGMYTREKKKADGDKKDEG